MQVSWIDPEDIRTLLAQIEGPLPRPAMVLSWLVTSRRTTGGCTPRMRKSFSHQKRRSMSIGRPKGTRLSSSLRAPARLTT